MSGWIIALTVIGALVGLILLAWFVITMNAIRNGIEDTSKALWKIARKDEEQNPAELSEDEKQLIHEHRKQKKEERIAKAFAREDDAGART